MKNDPIAEAISAMQGVRKAFGAPGDHGYGTPEGDALFALYKAMAALKNHAAAEPTETALGAEDARAQALREAAALCVSLRKEADRPEAESVGCMDCASAILALADSIQPAPHTEDNKPGTPLQFYGCAPVANAQTIGPVENWPLDVMEPCPRTGMAVIEAGNNANGLWWRTADGSYHIGYQLDDQSAQRALRNRTITRIVGDIDIYNKVHSDMDAGSSWEQVRAEIGFNEKRTFEYWEAYMVRRIINRLNSAKLEAAQVKPITVQDAAQVPEIAALIVAAEKVRRQIDRWVTVNAKAYDALEAALWAIAAAQKDARNG